MLKGGVFAWFGVFAVVYCISVQAQKNGHKKQDSEIPWKVQAENELLEALTQKILGHYEESRILLLRFTQNYPEVAEGHFRLAEINRLLGGISEAVESSRRAVRLDDQNKFYRQFLAELLDYTGQYKEAAAEYERLHLQNPTDPDYLESLAEVQKKMGKVADAVRTLEKLEAMTGGRSSVLERIYALYMQSGRYRDAYRTAEKLIQRRPDMARYQGLASDACKAMNNMSCARAHLTAALALDSLNPQARMAAAMMALEEKDYAKVVAYLEKAYESPDLSLDEKILSLLGLMDNRSFMAAQTDGMRRLMATLKKTHPGEARVWSAEGDFFMQRDSLPLALEAYRTAAVLDRSRIAIWRQVLFLCVETGRYDLALSYADTVLELNPVAADPFLAKSLAWLRSGFPEKARQALRAVEWMLEDNPQVRSRYHLIQAEINYREGRFQEAWSSAEKAYKDDPQSLGARLWMVLLFCLQPEFNGAFPEVVQSARQDMATGSAFARAVEAVCLARAGNKKEALARLQSLQTAGIYLSPLTWELMGDAYHWLGLGRESRSAWETALRQAPSLRSVQEKLKP